MKTSLFFILFILYNPLIAQISSDGILISDSVRNPTFTIAGDIDNDGDNDIVSASISGTEGVFWHENLDGIGNFAEKHTISLSILFPWSTYLGDLDGDNDIDLVVASLGGNGHVYWFENLNGLGNFGNPQIIDENLNAIVAIATDIDGDGDLDVVSGSQTPDNYILWYENVDGGGNFSPGAIISEGINNPNSLFSCDLDGDGDNDILSIESNSGKVLWFENINGNGSLWSEKLIIENFAYYTVGAKAADLDDDGDLDVIAAFSSNDKLVWYENVDGNGNFSAEILITNDHVHLKSFDFGDFDNDGDIDLVASSEADDKVAWYENMDGMGDFGPQNIITTDQDQPEFVSSGDLDGDGDKDIIVASVGDEKIVWYGNQSPLSIEDKTKSYFIIVLNPMHTILEIKSDIEVSRIEVLNNIGQLVQTNFGSHSIDVSNLSPGFYYVKIYDMNSNYEIKKVLKQ